MINWREIQQIQKIQEWRRSLSVRDRRAITGCGIILLLYIFYGLLWSPLMDYAAVQRKNLREARSLLVFMREAKQKINILKPRRIEKENVNSPVELMSFIKSQVEQKQLSNTSFNVKQASGSTINITFQNISFDSFAELLISIAAQRSVTINQLNIVPQGNAGLVNIEGTISI